MKMYLKSMLKNLRYVIIALLNTTTDHVYFQTKKTAPASPDKIELSEVSLYIKISRKH
jgi:hypothetical protein